MIVACRQRKAGGDGNASDETMTFDAATRIWRGRECLAVEDLVDEGIWPASGKNALDGQTVLLGITWKPTPSGVFTRFHISDIWLDETAMQRAARNQTEKHKVFIRSRWMPAWVDAVDYGKFGRATVTATLFGGMDESLYADFKANTGAKMAAAENTLRTWWPDHDGMDGKLIAVKKSEQKPPFGSSGIQLQFQVPLVLEGFRPGLTVRIRPHSWPNVKPPIEERIKSYEDRWPSPDIFLR